MKKAILIVLLVIAVLGGYFVSRSRLTATHLYPFGKQYQGYLRSVNIINGNGTWLEHYRAYIGMISDLDDQSLYNSALYLTLVPKSDGKINLPESVVKEGLQPVVEITAKMQGMEIFGERVILRWRPTGPMFHFGLARTEHYASIMPFFLSDKVDSDELTFDLLLKQ